MPLASNWVNGDICEPLFVLVRLTEGYLVSQRSIFNMNRRLIEHGFSQRLGLILACAALLVPPSLGFYLPVTGSVTQPLDEEESRGPVETAKIEVGAVHCQQDRRERPEPTPAVVCHLGVHCQHSLTHVRTKFEIPQAIDFHNGLGCPLIV